MINDANWRVFGETLRVARLAITPYPTIQQLADEAGVNKSIIQKIHTYEGISHKELLPKIAKAYKVDLEVLIKAYNTSKEARKEEVLCRKKSKFKDIRGFEESPVSKDAISAVDNSPKLILSRNSRPSSYYKLKYS